MKQRITREELLEMIFEENYEKLQGDKLRLVRVRVPGCEIYFAHLIGVSTTPIYRNLSLHIGTHLGEDHTGDSIGLMQMTPWESTVVAADIAYKAAEVQIGFLDRFNGSLILLGERENVRTAMQEVLKFFDKELNFGICELTET